MLCYLLLCCCLTHSVCHYLMTVCINRTFIGITWNFVIHTVGIADNTYRGDSWQYIPWGYLTIHTVGIPDNACRGDTWGPPAGNELVEDSCNIDLYSLFMPKHLKTTSVHYELFIYTRFWYYYDHSYHGIVGEVFFWMGWGFFVCLFFICFVLFIFRISLTQASSVRYYLKSLVIVPYPDIWSRSSA